MDIAGFQKNIKHSHNANNNKQQASNDGFLTLDGIEVKTC